MPIPDAVLPKEIDHDNPEREFNEHCLRVIELANRALKDALAGKPTAAQYVIDRDELTKGYKP